MNPDVMEWVIRRMSDGLPYDDERRERIAVGSRYLFAQISDDADTTAQAKVMNKFILPVFVRLTWEGHRMDIPVEVYAGEIQSLMESVLNADADGNVDPPEVINTYPEVGADDPEALLLCHCANEIKRGFETLYPCEVRS